ncbi:4Fe-4S binding protein [Candidatus Bathyarchaeota archaeon]|nr:4Fe-4S binding protein [Candidatus Bathyarchaeota archaeon]
MKKRAEDLGADLTGVAPVERFKNAPYGAKPEDLLPGAKYVFSFAIWHGDANLDVWDSTHNTYMLIGGGMHTLMLNMIASRLVVFLEKKGHKALFLPASDKLHARNEYDFKEGFVQGARVSEFSHRHAAVAAGLGEFGWNSLVLTPEYGPRVRFSSIITDAPLKPDEMYRGPKLCTDCYRCVDTCPMNAISKREMVKADFGDRTYEYARVDIVRCQWGQAEAMNPEGGSWETYPCEKIIYPPEKITYRDLIGYKYRNPWKYYQGKGQHCGRCVIFCESRRGRRGEKLKPRRIPETYKKSVLRSPGGIMSTITKEEVMTKKT